MKQSRHLRAVLVTDLSATNAALTFRIRVRTSGRPVLNRANTGPVMGICLSVDRYWIATRTSRGLVLVVVAIAIVFPLVLLVKHLCVSPTLASRQFFPCYPTQISLGPAPTLRMSSPISIEIVDHFRCARRTASCDAFAGTLEKPL